MSRRIFFCDDCGHRFAIDRLRERRLPRGGVQTYFACPSCKTEYHVSYTNKPIRKLHERLNFTRQALARAKDKAEYDRLYAQAEEMTQESRKLMSELRN